MNISTFAENILETKQRFSQSILWQKLREYYLNMGIEAWSEGCVPSFITSNVYIGNSYANLIFAIIKDTLNRGLTLNRKQPLYIIEAGTGHGKLSFYIVKALTKLCEQNKIPIDSFCYVMTDIAERNVTYWQTHPHLNKYLQLGVMDCAILDADHADNIHLLNRNIKLTPGCLTLPIVMVGNYIFDTLPHDAFQVIDGKLKESLIDTSLKPAKQEITSENILNHLKHTFTHHETSTEYYACPKLNEILKEYEDNINNAAFLVPINGIKCLKMLEQLTTNDFILISADKGYTDWKLFDDLEDPFIEANDYAALMVNYHFISRYFEKNNGFVMHMPNKASSFQVVTYVKGESNQYINLQNSFAQFIETFSPSDYFDLESEVSSLCKKPSLALLLAIFKLSMWDPHIFYKFRDKLSNRLQDVDIYNKDDVINQIDKVWDNFFLLETDEDVPFEIGSILYLLDENEKAIKYFERSIEFFGKAKEAFYNIALCYQELKQNLAAIKYFELAIEIDPNYEKAQAYLQQLTNKKKAVS